MLVKDAVTIIHGLSKPSKMPGRGYSIPAQRCITGSQLAKIAGTVCSGCYALKGNYAFQNVRDSLERRYKAIMNAIYAEERFGELNGVVYREKFIGAMVLLIERWAKGFFRWHDSGDIQSVEHMEFIAEIARRTPSVKHWIPTREIPILKRWIVGGGKIPDNLVIRVSAHRLEETVMLKGAPKGITYSSVDSKAGYDCPAPTQENSCGDCRACWNRDVENVDYHKH